MVASVTLLAREPFRTEQDRVMFAMFVADILSAGHPRFTPQELNPNTSKKREFSVASNNDWWVFFDQGDPYRVRIQHRYGIMEALEPVSSYVAYCWRAKIVENKPI